MLYKDVAGLKFPDEFIVRFFFKNSLGDRQGRVLELGSANGNNLRLFFEFGWECIGVDIGESQINAANANFAVIKRENPDLSDFSFVCADMLEFMRDFSGEPFDVVTLPSSLYYISEDDAHKLFRVMGEKKVLKAGGAIFLRMRSQKDYRYGRGERIGANSFRLSCTETGEAGCINAFYSESRLETMLKQSFGVQNFHFMHCDFGNYQNGYYVSNSDIVVWGTLPA